MTSDSGAGWEGLRNTAQLTVAQTMEGGASAADAFASACRRIVVRRADRGCDTSKTTIRGLSVRAEAGGRTGFASCTGNADEWSSAVSQAALANARCNTRPQPLFFSTQNQDQEIQHLPCASCEAPPLDEVEDTIAELYRLVSSLDHRVIACRPAMLSWEHRTIALAHSSGFTGSYCTHEMSLRLNVVVAGPAGTQSALVHRAAASLTALAAEEAAAEAVSSAADMLGASDFGSLSRPPDELVLDGPVTAALLGLVWPGLSGSTVNAGTSAFRSSVGRRVARDLVTLTDDPTKPCAGPSQPFDGEGVVTGSRTLIQNGVVSGLLHTISSSRDTPGAVPGNAKRSYETPPAVGPTNLTLAPGAGNCVGQTGHGLFIRSVQGLHNADKRRGTFSLSADGRVIRNGQLREPVAGIAVHGSIRDVLGAIVAVGGRPAASLTRSGLLAPDVVLENGGRFVR